MCIRDRLDMTRQFKQQQIELRRQATEDGKVILPTASGVSNEGGSSELLALVPAVSWPRVPAWGSLEPPRPDGDNAQRTRKNGDEMGEI